MANAGMQDIKCNIDTCKYNESSTDCTLPNITVGCDSSKNEAKSQCDTACLSFNQK